MRSVTRLWFSLLIFCLTHVYGAPLILAQETPVADLSIRLIDDIPDYTPPGTNGTFRFVITNNGPDDVVEPAAYAFSSSAIPYAEEVGAASIFFLETSSPENECFLIWGIPDQPPTDPLVIFFGIYATEIKAGDTLTCDLRYYVSPTFDFAGDERTASGQLNVRWHIFALNYNDPNPANDAIILPFRFWLAETIPTLSPFGLALMALSIFAAFVVLRRSTGRA